MIITKTPFRMSFFGGGTDMENYFRENGGAVLSTTFDKYCYVSVRHLPRFFDYSTELSYSRTERVTSIEDIQHPLIRNTMKMLDMLRLFSKTFATHYFACSDYAGKWLYGKNIGKSKRYKVIPNAINTEKYRFDPAISAEMRKSLGIEDKFVIGHIGRFVYQKNHDFLIDIFSEVHKQNDKAVLLLIGEGPLLEDVKAKVHRLGLDDFVIFLGVREDANRLYQAFDVFCLPSRYEGLGMVAIEAQISGLPTIVSNGIPGEAKITNRISYLNLNEKSETWAKKLIAFKFENRTDIEVKNDDYNISVQSRKMEEIYFRLIESEKLLLEGTLK